LAAAGGHPPPTDRATFYKSLTFGSEAIILLLLSLSGRELELLGEVLPDVVVLSTEPARDTVASLASTRGSKQESDGRAQYGAHCDPRCKQADIVPVRNGFLR
jgi:hypothetical protein